jgi:hypothetical protein
VIEVPVAAVQNRKLLASLQALVYSQAWRATALREALLKLPTTVKALHAAVPLQALLGIAETAIGCPDLLPV